MDNISPTFIQSPIENNYRKIKLYDVNLVTNTELHHEVLFQLSFHELYMEILNKYSTWFSMEYNEKVRIHICDYAI